MNNNSLADSSYHRLVNTLDGEASDNLALDSKKSATRLGDNGDSGDSLSKSPEGKKFSSANSRGKKKLSGDSVSTNSEKNLTGCEKKNDISISEGSFLGSRFRCTAEGVYENFSDGEVVWICSPLINKGLARDVNGKEWCKLFEVSDYDGKKHSIVIPQRNLHGREYQRELLALGLSLSPSRGASDKLHAYVLGCASSERFIRVSNLGWTKDFEAFVLCGRTIGTTSNIISSFDEQIDGIGAEKGTAEQWKASIASLCHGNSRLLFAVSAGFAAPLLELVGVQSGGFHFRGNSSIGKTILLACTCSLFGSPRFMISWRATDNGLESKFHCRSGLPSLVDEIGQAQPETIGPMVYMAGNGQKKLRANRNGDARPNETWSTLLLSTGEITLEQHAAMAGKRMQAGQEIRLVDIPADAGVGLGVFENLHGFADGAKFADVLKDRSSNYHGAVGIEYLQQLVENREAVTRRVGKLINDFINANVAEDAHGQTFRVANRFGLVAAAGELATEFGLTGWPVGDATKAVEMCFKDWNNSRGGKSNVAYEKLNALSQIRLFIEQNGESRFTEISHRKCKDISGARTVNRCGYYTIENGVQEFWLFPQSFKSEVCRGLDAMPFT